MQYNILIIQRKPKFTMKNQNQINQTEYVVDRKLANFLYSLINRNNVHTEIP